MIAAFLALLLLADDTAIRRTIAVFNHTHERATVLTATAEIPDFSAWWAPGQSQRYFEVTAIRFLPDGSAVAEARANLYGSVFLKRSTSATFILKREGAAWKIDSLRVERASPLAMPAIVPGDRAGKSAILRLQ